MVNRPKCMFPQPPKETTPTCGCHATGPVTAYETGVMLVFCQKHAAVDALLAALHGFLADGKTDCWCTGAWLGRDLPGHSPECVAAREALKSAEGK